MIPISPSILPDRAKLHLQITGNEKFISGLRFLYFFAQNVRDI